MTTTTALNGLAAIPIDHLHPSPNNPRENLTGIDELAVSIRENSLIQPLVVQRIPGHDGYQIVAGHRRHAACRKLGMTKVPCIIRKDMLPDEELLAMLVENGQRAGLDPIEEARALHKLKRGGLNDGEVGRKIGRSQSYVSGRLALLHLPIEEQEELRAGASQSSQPTTKPIGTLTTVDRYALIQRHNSSKGDGAEMMTPASEVMRTLTVTGHQSLVTPGDIKAAEAQVDDCLFRMLEPHEVAAGMAFPADYIWGGTRRQRVKLCGNAVTPPAARDLIAAVAESLS